MSDYTNTFGGASKDSGNDTILGAQHDTEYDAIATMSGTKANKITTATTDSLIKQTSAGDLANSNTGSATTNNLTVNGTLSVSGAFTSLGIDDNATGERVQITDSDMTLGPADGSEFQIRRAGSNTGILTVTGGDSVLNGANIRLDGVSHSSTGDLYLRTGANSWMVCDESAGQILFYTGVGSKTQVLTISASQFAQFQGGLQCLGSFTSLGIDDNATGERIQVADTATLLGDGVTAGEIYTLGMRDLTTGELYVTGGTSSATGGAIKFYGSTHATLAGDVIFSSSDNNFMHWDESSGDLEILTGVGAKTSALTIDASQNATFAGTVTLGSEQLHPITLDTEQATTSGTSITFSSIPSWVQKITIMLAGVSQNSNSQDLMLQIGDSGGIEASGYLGSGWSANTTNTSFTTGFPVAATIAAASVLHGTITLTLEDSANNTWVSTAMVSYSNTPSMSVGAGSKSLSGTLDRIRLTTVGGTATFDAGAMNILYE